MKYLKVKLEKTIFVVYFYAQDDSHVPFFSPLVRAFTRKKRHATSIV